MTVEVLKCLLADIDEEMEISISYFDKTLQEDCNLDIQGLTVTILEDARYAQLLGI